MRKPEDELREMHEGIHMLGRIEGDAEDLARYGWDGGLWQSFWLWIAALIRRDRLELIEDRDDHEAAIRSRKEVSP